MHTHLQPILANASQAAVPSSAHASPEDGSTELQLPEKLNTGLPSRDDSSQARAVTPSERQDAGPSTAEAGTMAPGTASTAVTLDRAQSLQHADSPPCKLSSSLDPGQLPTAGSLGSHCWDEGHSRSGAAAGTDQHTCTCLRGMSRQAAAAALGTQQAQEGAQQAATCRLVRGAARSARQAQQLKRAMATVVPIPQWVIQ